MSGPEGEKFVYRSISFMVKTAFTENVEFKFDINSYHRLIRFRIDITERHDPQGKFLDVTVRDRDYGFKMENYGSHQYDQ